MSKFVRLSIIAPAYNEKENLEPLAESFDKLARKVPYGIELIIVDDGSKDGTGNAARALTRRYPFVKTVSYPANRGKTYAIMRGLDISVGEYIAIFDADLQFDPDDLPDMVIKLDAGADLIAGYKVGDYQKPFISNIYNMLGRMFFSVPVRDMNALKVMRRQVFDDMPFRPDWHRYLVIWAHSNGFKIAEHPVKLRPRLRGKSKFAGKSRILIGLFDMISVWFQLKFARRPMLFFGTTGLISIKLAFLLGILAIILRFGFDLGYRPLLTLVTMLASIGVVLLIGGFLGEFVMTLDERIGRIERKLNKNTPPRQDLPEIPERIAVSRPERDRPKPEPQRPIEQPRPKEEPRKRDDFPRKEDHAKVEKPREKKHSGRTFERIDSQPEKFGLAPTEKPEKLEKTQTTPSPEPITEIVELQKIVLPETSAETVSVLPPEPPEPPAPTKTVTETAVSDLFAQLELPEQQANTETQTTNSTANAVAEAKAPENQLPTEWGRRQRRRY